MQPRISTRGIQNRRMAHCRYGMAFAPRHRVHSGVSHRWRTSAVRTGSGDPWPDSFGGRGWGWLPGLPSSSKYTFSAALEGLWSACSRTRWSPVPATIHRLPHHRHHPGRCAPGAAVAEPWHRSRSPCSGSAAPQGLCHRGWLRPAGADLSIQVLFGVAAAQLLPIVKGLAVLHQRQVEVDPPDHFSYRSAVAIGGCHAGRHLPAWHPLQQPQRKPLPRDRTLHRRVIDAGLASFGQHEPGGANLVRGLSWQGCSVRP